MEFIKSICFSKYIYLFPNIVYNNIEVHIMFSYRPLRIIMMDKKIKPSFICKEVGLSHNVGIRIMNDESIELKNLVLFCEYLGITLDQAVEIGKE
jgi:DNA-binding Xre family transcriptional regulator